MKIKKEEIPVTMETPGTKGCPHSYQSHEGRTTAISKPTSTCVQKNTVYIKYGGMK